MKAWHDFLKTLEKDLGKETVEKWLKPLKVLKFDAANLYLDATDSFQILWYQEHVTKELLDPSGRKIKLHFYLNGKPLKSRAKKTTPEESNPKQYFSPDHLASHATFENFIKEESPFLACDLLTHIDSTYNPIFLYGPAGCGKTHLLMATAHQLKQAGKNVFYVRTETFTEHVIRAFRTSSLQEFRPTYRNLDCLILDDVQMLKGKNTTQEELFHTFNRLHTQGMQIVLSASSSPRELEGIEERLKSRFEWGITLPLTMPTPSETKQILKTRSESLSLPLTELMLAHLLRTFPTLPSLIRALEALALRLHQSQLKLDIPMIDHLLQDLIREEEKQLLTPHKILQHVAATFRVNTEDILGRSQNKECVLPRKIAMYFCRTALRMPYLKIGEFFSRDHSTVMSSVKQIEKGKASKDKNIAFPLFEIQQKLA
ncbi:DnaA ATPase domain-containing protein [Simkania sp.]|uniref:DnaA ATPase domain-containing protein n=1 Tax=Simkania sp. TaxID=34094 RepID=UPI003B525BC2